LKLLSCGTLASRSGVLAAPRVSMSSRDTLIRLEPVGGTPRMLVPVMTTRSAESSDSWSSSAVVPVSGGWAAGSCGAGSANVRTVCGD